MIQQLIQCPIQIMNAMSISTQKSTAAPITNSPFICKYKGSVAKPSALHLFGRGIEQPGLKLKSL